jgi:hypothetical protein
MKNLPQGVKSVGENYLGEIESGGTSSRPYGARRRTSLHPGLRPGLSSAVSVGLILQGVVHG